MTQTNTQEGALFTPVESAELTAIDGGLSFPVIKFGTDTGIPQEPPVINPYTGTGPYAPPTHSVVVA
jgi:hypothetical protein